MKNYILLLLLSGLIVSCSSRRIIVSTTPEKTGPKVTPQNSGDSNKNTEPVKTTRVTPAIPSSATAYIERFKGIAISEMNAYGIPASITLAQGLLESGNGNSVLARESNNHFGIKCTAEWKGKTTTHDDDAKDECFRVYKNPEESFRDHSEFLKRKRYAFLFELDKNDYRGWAAGLSTAGYATNPRYAELLVNIIERYQLDNFDRKENPLEKIKREDKVFEEINANIPFEQKPELEKAPVVMKIYEVKSGDTLQSVGKRFGLSVEEIKTLNNISGADLKQGQLLLVSR